MDLYQVKKGLTGPCVCSGRFQNFLELGTAEFGMVRSVWVSVFLAHGPGSQPDHQPLLLSQAQSSVCSQAAVLVLGLKIVPWPVPAPLEVSPLQVPGHYEITVPVSVVVTAPPAVPTPPRT